MGWFEPNGEFIVEHLFCRDPSEEGAQLERLSDRLRQATYIVTFNGKSFDMPLVNTRYIMNRATNPAYGLPHLDLLHVARRIFGRRLTDRSLGNLEKAVLGFQRHGDIPGSEIPGVYHDYLNGGSSDPIVAVLEHNSMDLVALAALGGVLDRIYKDPEEVQHAADHLGLAKAAFFMGQPEHGDAHLHMAKDMASGTDKREALHMAAKQANRQKDKGRARDLWLQLLASFPDDPYAHLALSKYYEHVEKHYTAALEHAKKAFEAEGEGEEGNEHRLSRINRKKAKQNA